jgi:regulator of CtrA degradation
MVRVNESLESARQPVSFVEKLAGSEAFGVMFREGMSLVEAAAAYLDGAGREEAKVLPRAAALAYAAESMRMTTRLMQIASWLLLQRAVNQGEMTRIQAANDRHRVKLTQQELASNPEVFQRLPQKLRDLAVHSLRLQARIIHLDGLLYAPALKPPIVMETSPVEAQLKMLRSAFAQ